MEASNLHPIPTFSLESTIEELQEFISVNKYTHIPIVNNQGQYIGCVSEEDIETANPNENIASLQYALEHFLVRDTDIWLDVLECFTVNDTNIAPVLTPQNKFIGIYKLEDILVFFGKTLFLNEPGDFICVEKGSKDYSFSEIAQIVESNNAKILGMFIDHIQNDVTQITIKVGDSDLNAINNTFRRYSYQVLSLHKEDKFYENLVERSKYLDRYLNM